MVSWGHFSFVFFHGVLTGVLEWNYDDVIPNRPDMRLRVREWDRNRDPFLLGRAAGHANESVKNSLLRGLNMSGF